MIDLYLNIAAMVCGTNNPCAYCMDLTLDKCCASGRFGPNCEACMYISSYFLATEIEMATATCLSYSKYPTNNYALHSSIDKEPMICV